MAVHVVSYGGDGTPGAPGADGDPGSAGAATLNGATAIGATSITLDALPPTLTDGAVIAIDGGSNKCEIRRVDGISGNTLTLQSGRALKIAHSDGVNVWVVDDLAVPPEWWGATTDNAVDSGRALVNMLLDWNPTTYDIRGRGVLGTSGAYYMSSIPLFIPDKGRMELGLNAFSPFSLDCTIGRDVNDIPNQYFLYGAGQQVTATFNSVTDEVTLSASIGASAYSDVVFYPRQGSTLPTGIEEGRRYFILTGSGSSLTTQIVKSQTDLAADAVDFSTNGSGEIVAISTGLSRANGRIALAGNKIQGLNGMLQLTQQPSSLQDCRIEDFPVVGATIGGQQGYMPNLMIFNCWVGLEVAGTKINFFPCGNTELNDINVWFSDSTRWPQGAGDNWATSLDGWHFETPGEGTSMIQTLVPSATLTSGTFKLRFKNVKTGFINYNATAAQLQTELEAHAAIGAGNVTCTQLSGTNLSDGSIQVDFTGGTLAWSRFVGSTDTRFGGVLAVTDSTLGGGTLSNNDRRSRANGGRNVKYEYGRANRISNVLLSSVGTAYDGTRPYGVEFEGTAADVSAGTNHGLSLWDWMPYNQTPFVYDPLHSIDISGADSSSTGVAEFCTRYSRPARHGGTVGQHEWIMGEKGRRIKFNTLGAPQLEIQSATSGQTNNNLSIKDSSGTEGFAVDKDGWAMTKVGSKTHDWGSLASGSSDSTTVTVTGAAVGDFAYASMSVAPPAGVIYHAQVTASNTVTVTRFNISGSAHDPASGTLRAAILQPTT